MTVVIDKNWCIFGADVHGIHCCDLKLMRLMEMELRMWLPKHKLFHIKEEYGDRLMVFRGRLFVLLSLFWNRKEKS